MKKWNVEKLEARKPVVLFNIINMTHKATSGKAVITNKVEKHRVISGHDKYNVAFLIQNCTLFKPAHSKTIVRMFIDPPENVRVTIALGPTPTPVSNNWTPIFYHPSQTTSAVQWVLVTGSVVFGRKVQSSRTAECITREYGSKHIPDIL